ncbi:MAG: HlyD family efflux transporter periplasmic adaptor subunit [Fuscovulum sp.]|nr:HlyD family efflux transporter periplasmic adaptor subunit [Fuscovulum sp.]
MTRILPYVLAGTVVAAGLVWAFLPRAVTVETALVAPRDLTVGIEAEGTARIREVFTVSAPIGGQLDRVALHPGDAVEVGDALARIGPAAPALLDSRARAVAEATAAAARAAVDLAHAQLAQAEAARDYAQGDADRARALYDRAAVSERVLDSAVLALRTAEMAVESARATLAVRLQEVQSAEAVLTGGATGAASCCVDILAPVAGRILRVATEDAQVVAPGTPILDIGDPANLEISVEVLSRDAVRIAPGAAAVVTGWGGPDLGARVERVEPAAVTRVSALGLEEQRVEVILSLAGDPAGWQALGHDFRVIVRISLWQGNGVLSIPVGALFRDGSDWATYVVADGRAELRRIVIGERNADFAMVVEGLAAGDAVILHPGDTVAPGVAVTAPGG